MSFSARLTEDLYKVEPGASIPVTLEVANRSDQAINVEVVVEGLDGSWGAIPEAHFAVDARDTRSERIFLRPPRESNSVAGTYPFVVKVRSVDTGDVKSAQGILEVQTFHHLTLDVFPKRGVIAGTSRQANYELSVANLGNTPDTVSFFARDNEDHLVYEIDPPQVDLAPGEQITANVVAMARKRPLLDSPHLTAINFSARSDTHANIEARTSANLEERPRLSPMTLVLVIFAMMLAAAYFAFWPKPPKLESLTANASEIQLGQEVVVSWSSENATNVQLEFEGQTLTEAPRGSRRLVFETEGTTTVRARAIRDDLKSSIRTVTINVIKPAEKPAPKVTVFDVTPTQVNVGQPYQIRYKISGDATRAILNPIGEVLDPAAEGKQLVAAVVGEFDLQILAIDESTGARAESKIVKLKIVDGPLASVKLFEAENPKLEAPGEAKLTWQLENAVRAEMLYKDQRIEIDPRSGTRAFAIDETTEFTLLAYDERGARIVKRLTVQIVPPEPVTIEPSRETQPN